MRIPLGPPAVGRVSGHPVRATSVGGTADVLTPPYEARRIARLIPGARLELLRGGGHMLYLSGGGDTFIYMHLESYSVGDGAHVSQGQQVGTVGMTGNATAPPSVIAEGPGSVLEQPKTRTVSALQDPTFIR